MTHRKGYLRIYASWWHLAVTFAFIVLPFVFLLFFTRYAHLSTSTFFANLAFSFGRILVAYVIAVGLAWVAAITLARGHAATWSLPLFDVLQSFPTFAVLPLAILVWGPSNFTVIFFLVLTIIWPIFFSLVSSLHLIRHDWEEAVKICDVSGWQYFTKFLLPVSIPGLVTGSIVGLGEGWEALIATEIIVQIQQGLGSFFQTYAHNTLITTLGVFGFMLIIFSINKLIWLPLLEQSHLKMSD